MATCRDIITDALKMTLRESGLEPSPDEAEDGMNALQSFYDGLVFGGMFGELEDVYLDTDDIAEEGKRYFIPSGITLTAATSEYVDANGVTRQPRDLAIYETVTAAGVRSVKLYDRTQWIELTGLTLGSDAPLSVRGRFGLAAALAISPAFAAMFADTATLNPDIRRAGSMFIGRLMDPASTQDRSGAEYF